MADPVMPSWSTPEAVEALVAAFENGSLPRHQELPLPACSPERLWSVVARRGWLEPDRRLSDHG